MNSDAYLKRLCEVNLITTATPSMHNDAAVMESLSKNSTTTSGTCATGRPPGCVEPTLSGKHIGHTNCMMMNMVAALEMAMNNGRHPLMDWKVGPGDRRDRARRLRRPSRSSSRPSPTQFKFLIDKSIEYNNMLGEAHQYLRPTPLLSSLIDGLHREGPRRDEGRREVQQLRRGLHRPGRRDRFAHGGQEARVRREENHPSPNSRRPWTRISRTTRRSWPWCMNRVPLFGSGSDEAVAMAQRVAKFAHDYYGEPCRTTAAAATPPGSGPCRTTSPSAP